MNSYQIGTHYLGTIAKASTLRQGVFSEMAMRAYLRPQAKLAPSSAMPTIIQAT